MGARRRTIPRLASTSWAPGNPTPAYTSAPRGEGLDNLYTCALVAVNVDTGKMAWYYQTSPHDTHDWDSAQTPVLVDGDFNGRPRKMVVTAARNGYFFVVDRVTGEHLLTSKFSDIGELGGAGAEREGAAGAHSGQGPSHRRRAGLEGEPGRRQLAAAVLQPDNRAVLRADRRDLRDVLPDRTRSARRDRSRRQGRAQRRDVGQLPRRRSTTRPARSPGSTGSERSRTPAWRTGC